MSNLPSNWLLKPIGMAFDINPRVFCALSSATEFPVHFVPMKAVAEEAGGINIDEERPLSHVMRGYTAFTEGDVIFAKITPCMENGKIAVIPKLKHHIAYGSTEFHVLKATGLVNPYWLASYLSQVSVRRSAKRDMTGSAGQLRVPTIWFSTCEIPIPPLPEQERIIPVLQRHLAELDMAMNKLERIKIKLKRYRASVLQAAVEGRLTAEWRRQNPPSESGAELLERLLKERRAKWEENQLKKYAEQGRTPPRKWKEKYPEPAKPDTTGLPELPEGWVWASTEQLGSVQLGRQRSPKNRSKDHATVYIRAANITESGLDLSNLLDMEFTPDEQERYRLSYGDIVLSEASGSPSQVGKPAIWRDEITLCCFQNTVIRLRPLADLSEYLLNYYQHCYTNGIFSKIAGGVGINHLSADKFSNIPVALPPTNEREVIRKVVAARLNVAQRTAGKVENIIQQSEKLRQSILKRAFEGRLVPQDPNDESASVLLERIRAERAAQAATVKPARTQRKAKGHAG